MVDENTLNKVTAVLRDVFDNDDLVVTPELTARQVTGWDSLGNVRLFVELEQAFALRFSAAEIGSLKNVGQLVDLIDKKAHRATSG